MHTLSGNKTVSFPHPHGRPLTRYGLPAGQMQPMAPPASGAPTQAPSPNNEDTMGKDEAAPMPMATAIDTSTRPPALRPEPVHQVVPAAPEYDLNEIIHAGKFPFNMKITRVYAIGGANYNPQEAVPILNAKVQDLMEQKTGLEIPKGQFMTEYKEPGKEAPSDDHGYFALQVPMPLKPIVMIITGEKGALLYTGDERGNRYQLEYFDYVAPDLTNKKARREKNTMYFFRLCPLNKYNGLPQRTIRDVLALHLAKFAIFIQPHEDAFKQSLDADREQWDGDWHVEYNVDWNRIPRDDRGIAPWLVGLKDLTLDEVTNEKAFLKFKPDRMANVFDACNICFKPLTVCQCNMIPQAKPTGKKPQTAAERNAQAKKRMKKRADMDMSF